jgi:hypothetical protein
MSNRCCRICYDDSDDDTNPLFRPCLCRGTMRWVHVECLQAWRQTSVNPKSFYKCEQCHFEYVFGNNLRDQFFLARLLAMEGVKHLVAITLLTALVFVFGFVGKACDPNLEWIDVWQCFNLRHMLAGATATGLFSICTWATSLGGLGGGGGWRMVIGNGWDGARGGGGGRDLVSTVLLVAAVVAGLALAMSSIYERLEGIAKGMTRAMQAVVLDVQGPRDEGNEGPTDDEVDGQNREPAESGDEPLPQAELHRRPNADRNFEPVD